MDHLPKGWRGPVKVSLWVAAVLFIMIGIALIVSCTVEAIEETVDFLFYLTTIAFCLESIWKNPELCRFLRECKEKCEKALGPLARSWW